MLLSRGVEDAKKNTGIKSRQKKNKGAKKGSIKDTQSTKKQHFSRAKKKLCLDDRDTNLSIKIEIQCRVLKSDPQDLANSRRTKRVNYVVFVFNFIFITFLLLRWKKRDVERRPRHFMRV